MQDAHYPSPAVAPAAEKQGMDTVQRTVHGEWGH
jgi:hypothetical protein